MDDQTEVCDCPDCTRRREVYALVHALAKTFELNQPARVPQGILDIGLNIEALTVCLSAMLAQFNVESVRMMAEQQIISYLFPETKMGRLN